MPGPRRPLRGRLEPQDTKTNIQMLQLIVCLFILGAVLLLRMSKPDEVKAFLSSNISQGADAQEAVTYIGEKLKEAFKLAPAPQPVDESTAQPSQTPSQTPEETAQPEETKEQNSEQISPTPYLGVGGFTEPAIFLQEGFLPSLEDDESDDTLPLPFGLEKPEKADYTVHELPFKAQLPAAGVLSSGFGYRTHPVEGVENKFHYGVDIAAKTGTAIKPFGDGTVALTGNSKTYGLYVMVKHEGGYVTLYAHCSKILVKAGQKVALKDTIAKVGSTGEATGPHVHLELRYGNSLLNPSYHVDIPEP